MSFTMSEQGDSVCLSPVKERNLNSERAALFFCVVSV